MAELKDSGHKKLLQNILECLVQYPDKIKISEKTDTMGILLTIEADKDDLKFIIGKNGEMINAIRKIIRAYGLKNKALVSVRVFDPSSNEGIQQAKDKIQEETKTTPETVE